jgi:diguanylate cyclase (GGDEF)-like protein
MKYKLSDLIDFTELQDLMEAFHRATGINHALLDRDGKVLTAVGWQRICSRFHHTHPHSGRRCLVNIPAVWERRGSKPYQGHKCRNGLFDYSTPVIIDGEHVANIFTGQILHEPPNLERFAQQAEEFCFDREAYLEEVGRIAIVPRERMPDIMAFLVCLAQILGTNGLARLRQLEAEDGLRRMNRQLAQRVEERTAELSEINRLLQQSHDLLAKLSEQVPGVLFQYKVTPCGHASFPFSNQAMQEIYEVSPEEVREDATVLAAYHHPEDAKGIVTSLRESARSLQPWHYEYRVVLPEQGLRWRLGNARPEILEDGSLLWHGFITDITDRKRLQEELERQARLDYLTGLANRRHFMEQAERELARTLRYRNPLTMLMLDIDHFKSVNDTYGHKIGDQVLQKLSAVCRESLREFDVIGRLGGEEFAVLLPMTDADRAWEIAERLRQSLARSVVLLEQGLPLNFTVSIGVAQLADGDINVDTLLHQADQALYQAKHGGRNQVCIYRGQA